uniref:Transmembrane protein 53 n=1 Tax=Eptatretus burgeri TaxID=7764 RepID=A0A8C4WWA2_EPTBU
MADHKLDTDGRTNEPIVFLLGWAGCHDRHLAKYTGIYHQQGCITIRYTARPQDIFLWGILGTSQLSNTAHKLLDLLFDIGVNDHPILFHSFSNGGALLYRYFAEAVNNTDCAHFAAERVIGAVFDSGPGERHIAGSLRALNTTLQSSVVSPLRYVLLFLFFFFTVAMKFLILPLGFCDSLYSKLLHQHCRWPELYLYSRADTIVQYKDVEHIMAARNQFGVITQAVDFGTSEHVQHYRRFPQRYQVICCSFLKHCLLQNHLHRVCLRPDCTATIRPRGIGDNLENKGH